MDSLHNKLSRKRPVHTSMPGCQDSLQRLQKAKKHLGHCAQFWASSRQALLQRGQNTTSGILCRLCASSSSSQRPSCSAPSSPARFCRHAQQWTRQAQLPCSAGANPGLSCICKQHTI